MTESELKIKLSEIEWEDFEVKEAKSEVPKNSWETISAFANTNGGWLILGVKQIGKIFEFTGVGNAEKIEQDFLNTLRGGKFNTFLDTEQKLFKFEEKTLLGFYIKPSNKKPIYFNTPANTFIRRGSSDQRATKEEIDSMFRDQTFGTKTSEKVSGTNRESLNNTSLNRYRDYMARFNPDVSYNRFTEEEFLTKLRIIENGNCTYGGLLMLGNRDIIERHFPDFRIDLLEIPGTSYSDAKLRYTYRLDEHENLWEYYFECFSRLKNRVDVKFTLTSDGFGQELSAGLIAIREALVNLLMHTDYFSPGKPRIRIFDHSIEFYNPGGLPKDLQTLKSKDISLPRNPIIAKLFRMVKLSENVGFGFEKIENNWLIYNNSKPEYDIDFDSVIVRFNVDDNLQSKINEGVNEGVNEGINEGVNEGINALYNLIKENPNRRTPFLAEKLNTSVKNVERWIKALKTQNKIEFVGNPKTGGYILKKGLADKLKE